MIGIYHNKDLDGFASGAIIKMKYPNAEMIGYDYGQILDITYNNQEIIMADVSLPMDEMEHISLFAKSFTWVDHHVSAINNFNEYKKTSEIKINSVLEIGKAACELTWGFLYGTETPRAIKLLSQYDTWQNKNKAKWENEILPFQFGVRSICNSLDTFPVELLLHDNIVPDIIDEGITILRYQSQVNELQCKKSAFEIEFEGLKAICLNGGGFNSDVFKSVYDENKHDIMIPFQFNGEYWTVSLYTTKDNIDCSLIAKSKGGGGHKKAAGFQTYDIETIINY